MWEKLHSLLWSPVNIHWWKKSVQQLPWCLTGGLKFICLNVSFTLRRQPVVKHLRICFCSSHHEGDFTQQAQLMFSSPDLDLNQACCSLWPTSNLVLNEICWRRRDGQMACDFTATEDDSGHFRKCSQMMSVSHFSQNFHFIKKHQNIKKNEFCLRIMNSKVLRKKVTKQRFCKCRNTLTLVVSC